MSDSPTNQFEKSKYFNLRYIRRGVVIFVVISIIAFTGIFLYTNTGAALEVWSSIKWFYLLIGLLFIAVDLYLGGLRNHIFVNEFVPGISQMVSIRANLANIFMGAVTPSQSGGGPAQWYILYRSGVKIPDIIGVSFYNWISTVVFFPLTGAFAIYILKDKTPDGFVLYLTQFAFSIFTTILVVVIVGLFAPQAFSYVISILVRLIGIFNGHAAKYVDKKANHGLDKLIEYRNRYVGLIVKKPRLMVYSFVLTILLYFNKYALAYILVLGFGIQADFWSIIAIQALVYLLLYFAPSPGGSGIAEVSISALMASVIAEEYVASFTLLYRSFLVFIPAMIGSYVILKQLSKES